MKLGKIIEKAKKKICLGFFVASALLGGASATKAEVLEELAKQAPVVEYIIEAPSEEVTAKELSKQIELKKEKKSEKPLINQKYLTIYGGIKEGSTPSIRIFEGATLGEKIGLEAMIESFLGGKELTGFSTLGVSYGTPNLGLKIRSVVPFKGEVSHYLGATASGFEQIGKSTSIFGKVEMYPLTITKEGKIEKTRREEGFLKVSAGKGYLSGYIIRMEGKPVCEEIEAGYKISKEASGFIRYEKLGKGIIGGIKLEL